MPEAPEGNKPIGHTGRTKSKREGKRQEKGSVREVHGIF
jgi:hypothetical protein